MQLIEGYYIHYLFYFIFLFFYLFINHLQQNIKNIL